VSVKSEICNPKSAIRDPQSEIIRVLLIEDSPGYAEIVKIMLNKVADARFDVVCARRLSEGLECLSTGGIDVVLLDLKLPDSRGIGTFDRVYAQAPRVPVIVLTVTDNDALAVGAVKKGAQDYLVKDQVDVKVLVQAIRYSIERKRVEGDLKETNIFLRNILDSSSSISIISNDLEGKILFWNKGAENMFGYKAEEVVGRCKADILYPADDEETQKTIVGIRSFIVSNKQEISCEVREVTKDGHSLWINLTCTPRLDERGHVIGILGIGEDITVRKWTEEAWISSEARLRTIIQHDADAIIIVDRKGIMRFINPAAEILFGRKGEGLEGKSFGFPVVPGEKAEIDIVRKGGGIAVAEMRTVETEWDKEPAYLVSVRDITDHKQTEEALRRSEEKYRSIIENIQEGFFELDLAGNFTFVNDTLCRLIGYSRGELIGKNNRQYTDEETAKKTYQIFNRIYRTGEPIKGIEEEYIKKDGMEGFAELSVSLINDAEGKPIGFRGISHDITERKQAEEQLRGQALIFENIHDGIIVTDLEGNIVRWNPAAEGMFGYYKDEVVRKTVSGLTTKIVKGTLHDSRWHGEMDFNRKDGTKGTCETTVIPLRDERDNITAVFGVFRDITEAKEIDRMKSELISNVSHELRTPLTTIKEGISLVVDGSLGRINADQKAALAIAKQDIDRLARLINDLLDISKIEAGRMELKKTSVGITSLAEEVLFSFQNQAGKKHIQLKTSLQRTLPSLYIDPDKIRQVLANLISNSIKFTPENGSITVGVKDKGNEVEISVADTGVGISPDNIARLFDRFSQFNRVYGPGERGTGLGLAISKEIVEMHGGRISVESEVGKGSTFTFSVPQMSQDDIFRAYLTTGLREAVEKNCPLSFVVARMKNLEKIEGGHAGEKAFEILREIEELIAGTLRRKGDTVSRYKYGEIVIAILMDTAKKDAQTIKERIGQAIEAEMQEQRWPKAIELSLGVVTYPDDAKDEVELINKISQGFWVDEITGERAAQGGKDG
jgi:PAS domain S-box-containing protein